MRFYVDIGVNLGLQFIIGLLITVGLVSLGGLSYPNESHLKNKIKKSSQMIGSVGSHMILQSYHFLRSYYDFKLFDEVGS